MDRTSVLMLFGGENSEHEVSISSARNVYAAIDDDKFDVHLCYIDRTGKWWLIEEFGSEISSEDGRQLLPVLGESKLVIEGDDTDLYVDVILPILHGRNGEDGTVQGLAQLLHVPIVGCDVTASGTAMNKLATKEILSDNKIPIIPYVVHRVYEDTPDFSKLTMKLGSPLFVKPARAGSSVGVSKVHSENELITALELAHEHDPIALIEQAIVGQEFEVAILGTPPHQRVSGVGEIIPGEDFYTYNDKYASGSGAQVSVDANLDEQTQEKIRAMADLAYVALDCRGLARVDFVMGEDKQVYLMEINTMPGFTNISMYPKLWRKEGIAYPQLIELLIEDAITNGTMKTAN